MVSPVRGTLFFTSLQGRSRFFWGWGANTLLSTFQRALFHTSEVLLKHLPFICFQKLQLIQWNQWQSLQWLHKSLSIASHCRRIQKLQLHIASVGVSVRVRGKTCFYSSSIHKGSITSQQQTDAQIFTYLSASYLSCTVPVILSFLRVDKFSTYNLATEKYIWKEAPVQSHQIHTTISPLETLQ